MLNKHTDAGVSPAAKPYVFTHVSSAALDVTAESAGVHLTLTHGSFTVSWERGDEQSSWPCILLSLNFRKVFFYQDKGPCCCHVSSDLDEERALAQIQSQGRSFHSAP